MDWILVSLRTNINSSSEVFKAACLLLKNGTVQFINDEVCSLAEIPYYIVVQHRNHLPAMTESAISISNGMLSYDFTSNQRYVDEFGLGIGQNLNINTSGQDVYALISGNYEQPSSNFAGTDINVNDKAMYLTNNNTFAIYSAADGNFTGDTNVNDLLIFQPNNYKFSSAPQ